MKRSIPWWVQARVALLVLVSILGMAMASRSLPQVSPEQFHCGASALSAIGSTRYQALFGDPKRALEESQKAVYFARCTPDRRAYLLALEVRALALTMAGQAEKAKVLNEQIVVLATATGQLGFAVGAFHGLVGLELWNDRPEAAAKALERALDLAAQASPWSLDGLVVRQHLFAIRRILPLVYQVLGSQQAVQSVQQTELKDGFFARLTAQATAFGFGVDKLPRVDPAIHEIHQKRTREGRVRRSPQALPPASSTPCALGHQGLASLEEAVVSPRWSPLPLSLGVLDFARGRDESSLRRFEGEALKSLVEGAPLSAAFALSNTSTVLWSQGRFEEAIARQAAAVTCFEVAANATESIPFAESRASGARRGFFPVLIEMLALDGRDQEAFLAAERARAAVLRRSVGAGRAPGRARLSAARSRELAASRTALSHAESRLALLEGDSVGLEREVTEGRARYEGELVRAILEVPELAPAGSSHPLTLPEIQGNLAPGVTLVSYYMTDLGLHAWVLERDSFQAFSLPALGEDPTAVPCFADFVRRGNRGVAPRRAHCADGRDLAESLYSRLFAPLRGVVRGSRLILVPHGSLHFVPFGALRNPQTQRTLVEDFTITHAPSVEVLRFLGEKESPFNGRALLFGDPDFVSPALKPLPGARVEVAQLGAQLGVRPLVGSTASETALDQALAAERGEWDVLHFAVHGVYLPGSPRLSHLALAPGGGQDGNLEVHEIYSRLDLTGVNLVVLSACDTALGERTGGDEIVGLTRAFLYAGASGVVSTLWQVDDAASTELMVSFYLHLKAGETAAEALRHAQLEMLRRPGRKSPHYWAGFVLTGDPRARWGA